ncbi:MAG: hypothetical protein QN200_03310 [Armatimonadota bacterium]|nr:hypothetical protein [Armatimonadota bacterium]MDR7444947.1 hypothetical protein [Armatimonadota bacterium]MDR7615118.1 hypothetical protein [Armatimonadota bacterium]
MATLVVGMEDAVLLVRARRDGWQAEERLRGKRITCVAGDPERSGLVLCGTFGEGLWRSTDGGETWERVGEGVVGGQVTAVALHAGVVYAGTEPSAVFRSEDGGTTWRPLPGLLALPSHTTWSFPPRPHTHHVRWIAPDPHAPDFLLVAIEAGALVRSPDGGRTWLDRVPGGPYDAHTVLLHPRDPGRIYVAAGDGYFESRDGGETWTQPEQGLRYLYLWGLAVHPEDPDAVLVSAGPGPYAAHNARDGESVVYRRAGGAPWRSVAQGLPDPKGTTVSTLLADPRRPGVVYAANNRGVYRSEDFGAHWERLPIPWEARYGAQRVEGLAEV